MTDPVASVIVPVFNRLDQLRLVLDGFAAQRTPAAFEVVVVDDGSDPPADRVMAGRGNRFRYLAQPNQGRSAAINTGLKAARGEILIICDADIIPSPGFIADHLTFHRHSSAEEETHLGDVSWGVVPPPLAALLGPRANPRMVGLTGSVPWTLWYTDNWSLKRQLVDSGIVRFDESFRACYWEDLEMAHRLIAHGIRNSATPTAVGYHLQCRTLEERLEVFARSVPNLLHLAGRVDPDETVTSWLSLQHTTPELNAAGEVILCRTISMIEAVTDRSADLDLEMVQTVAISLSDAIFRCGMQRGFARYDHRPPDRSVSELVENTLLPLADLVRTAREVLLAVGAAIPADQLLQYGAATVREACGDDAIATRFGERATWKP